MIVRKSRRSAVVVAIAVAVWLQLGLHYLHQRRLEWLTELEFGVSANGQLTEFQVGQLAEGVEVRREAYWYERDRLLQVSGRLDRSPVGYPELIASFKQAQKEVDVARDEYHFALWIAQGWGMDEFCAFDRMPSAKQVLAEVKLAKNYAQPAFT